MRKQRPPKAWQLVTLSSLNSQVQAMTCEAAGVATANGEETDGAVGRLAASAELLFKQLSPFVLHDFRHAPEERIECWPPRWPEDGPLAGNVALLATLRDLCYEVLPYLMAYPLEARSIGTETYCHFLGRFQVLARDLDRLTRECLALADRPRPVRQKRRHAERDAALYARRREGMTYKEVLTWLKKNGASKGWQVLTTEDGVRMAVKEHCAANGLPLPGETRQTEETEDLR
jgi:hypothetical protein